MGFIVIDYDSLVLVLVFAFAAIGLSRGWLTEFINTILLMLLSILLVKPEMLEPILTRVNKFFMLLWAWLKTGFSLDLNRLGAELTRLNDVIDPNNPYPVLLLLTIVLLAVQYAGTRIRLTGELTALSRILGAILGAINANIVLSLGKELIRRHTQTQAASVSAQQAVIFQTQASSVQSLAPNGIALALQDVPDGFLPEGIWIGVAVLAIGVVLLVNHFTNVDLGNR